MDGRVCHPEWSKSEREKQILHINAYMWNLEKWYRWTYLQGRGRNTGAENGHVNTEGEDKEKGELRVRIDMYTLPRVK